MATVATLDTVMRLNSTAFRQGMVQAAAQANSSLGEISKQAGATASVLLSLKRAADTFGSFYLLKEGIGSLLEAQVQLQAIHYTLLAATGSSTQAAAAFQFVSGESAKLGLILPDAAQGFANLSASATAAGVSMKDQQQLFDAYAKSASSLHLSTVQSNRALLALEQMFAKGKVQAQELRLQLGQAIPGAAQRFQNAVMEMTKGTDLAGKSFDQLLEAGDLTTSKFLPALVEALQASGRGWEAASQGLNANLNRVQSEWFKLKAEVSGGLFSDVATAGAGLLADNLQRVATGMELVAGVALARLASGGLDKALAAAINVTSATPQKTPQSASSRAAQEYQGTRMAASAEAEYASAIEARTAATLAAAEASALENQVIKDAAAAALSDAKSREIEAFFIKDAALAEMQRVEAAIALNESMGTGAAAKRASIDLDARLAATSRALVISEGQITAALVEQTAARNTLAMAEAREVALRGGVLGASTAASAAASAAANVRTAEAALGGFAAAAGRAAKSFGAFAMSLVGGPWGLAVAAIGAVGYAIYAVNKSWEDYLAHADEVAKANEEVTQTLDDMAKAYTDVATRPDAGALSAGLDSVAKSSADARKELDDLIAKRDTLLAAQKGASESGAVIFGGDTQISELDAKIAHAQTAFEGMTAAASKAQSELAAELAPAIQNSVNPALDLLASRVYGAKDAFTALQGLASLPSAFEDLVAQATAASKALDAYTKETGTSEAAALKAIQAHGKSNEGLAQVRYNLLQNSAAYKNMTADQKAAAASEYQTDAALGRGLDALKEKHHKLSTAVADAYASLKNTQEGQLATLQGQLAGTDGYSEAQKTLNKMLAGGTGEFRKMTAAQQANAIATQRQIVADTEAVDLMNLKADGARKLADLDREIADEQATRARQSATQVEGVGHGTQWNAERQAIDEVTAATQKKIQAEDAAYRQSIDNAAKTGATAAERAQIDETHLQMLGKITAAGALDAQATQDNFDAMRAAQSSWANGLQAGIENFQRQQQNNAAAATKMVDDLTSGFSSAFVDFADGAKSAKDAFGSFIDDMYKQALKFLADKAIQAFFDSFGLAGNSQTPGTTAGGWGSLFGNFMTAAMGSSGSSGTTVSGGSSAAASVGIQALAAFGLAGGGTAHAWGAYSVAENGPEILKVGNRNILMMGDQSGTVVPNNQIGQAAGNTTVTNIYVQPTSTRRTADQIATANARTQRIATTRNN